MHSLKNLYSTAGRHPIVSAIIITLLAAGALFVTNQPIASQESNEQEKSLPEVTLNTAQTFAGGDTISLLGDVRAASEAAITTERAGRVVSVRVSLADSVRAGQVLATLENAAESAAVVQAEGVYEAAVAAKAQALAGDAQNTVGVDESQNTLQSAQNSAINTYKSAYTTVNGIILNSIDTFFTSPNTTLPGLRISGLGQTRFLNSERADYRLLLQNWQAKASQLNTNSDIPAALNEAEANLERTVNMVDIFINLLNRQNANNSRYTETELQTFSSNFTSLRSSLVSSQNAIKSARSGLQSAKDAGARADINTSVSGVPAAEAQIKQALGSLRSAQANYAKTVLRTPISGTINSLAISVGDFVGSFKEVAKVANNNALEIVTFVSDKEREVLAVGDTVTIENDFTGRISQIAPAINSETRKTEVRIAAQDTDIKNGETVSISKTISATSTNSSVVSVPLSAVKFTAQDGFMFTVDNGELKEIPVQLGTIRGNAVEITEGLSATDSFVRDARGLLAGTEVTVTN